MPVRASSSALVLCLLLATPLHAATPPDARLLLRYADAALRDWQVPGAVIAVVKDDKVVLLQGLGVREVGKPETVDGDTLFPIASLTKGFTATLAAVEVAGGRLAWDRRMTDLLPGFSVADPWVTHELRLDDLLTHRTGWQGEIDYLWMERLTTDALLARMPDVKQGPDGFRVGYTYLNVPYVVAGEAIARGAGKPYTTLVRERLLEPLGMNATRVSAAEFAATPNRVAAHSDLDGTPRAIPLADGDAVAPAAALHSTASDMARWLRFHLGDGSLDGRRLLSAEQLAELHEPQNLIPRGAFSRKLYPSSHFQAYARGWVVQDYLGRAVVWNTGGLYGAACSIAMVPEERLGVVVLTNGPRISLPEALVFRILDAWLGAPLRDWSGERLATSRAGRERAAAAEKERALKADAKATPKLPLDGYAGTYRAPLLGDLEVNASAGKLRFVLGALAGGAPHWRNDAYLIAWDNPFYGSNLATFVVDAEGRAARVDIEEVGSFERVTMTQPSGADAAKLVADTERAFARTMATRDHAAFTTFLSDEAIFFTSSEPLRGKQQVADAWKSYFDGVEAPFAWAPTQVEVLESGILALSTGPVHDPKGAHIANFTSIWRLEEPGNWRIIFDKGGPVCPKP